MTGISGIRKESLTSRCNVVVRVASTVRDESPITRVARC